MVGGIKKIFKDNWGVFSDLNKGRIRKNVYTEVKRMISCGSLEAGYIEFKCVACGTIKKVGFRCKSRFCTSCGKKRSEDWSDDMAQRLIKTGHRHMVFTIPEELRIYFGKDRELLALLPKYAAEAIISWFRELNKKESFTPGIVAVIHTFGRDLKWNPHVHLIVTEGGAGNKTIWRKVKHISYKALRKRWQKLLLDAMELKLINMKKKFRELKNKLYKKLENGFYVYGKGEVKTAKGAAKYIGRYASRPAIAESRILKYDGDKVKFYYERHEDGKRVEEEIDVFDFIGRIIRHIPEKNFKMIRYYGIYAKNTRHKDKVYKVIDEKVAEYRRKMKRWQIRILVTFGINPLSCETCGAQIRFHDIVYNGRSVRERLKKEIILSNQKKIDKLVHDYGVIKGITHGKMEPLYT